MEPTPYSLPSAAASGRGSCPALDAPRGRDEGVLPKPLLERPSGVHGAVTGPVFRAWLAAQLPRTACSPLFRQSSSLSDFPVLHGLGRPSDARPLQGTVPTVREPHALSQVLPRPLAVPAQPPRHPSRARRARSDHQSGGARSVAGRNGVVRR